MQPQNQTVLTLIVALALSSAFVGVYALEYQYNQTTPIIDVWNSDSNMEFSQIDTTLVLPELDGLVLGLGSYQMYGFPTYTSYEAFNSTGVYLGNDTWGASMIGWAADTYAVGYYHVPIDVKGADTFLAKDITINISLPGDPIHLSIYLGGYTDPQTTLVDATGVTLSNTIAYDGSVTPYYKATYHLTSYQALTWYNLCQKDGITPNIAIYIYDLAKDGMSSYAMQTSINITGSLVNTWSLQDSVNVVVGGSIALNVFLGIYMTDAIDWNNLKRKDLKKGR